MTKQILKSNLTGEYCTYAQLESGLKVYISEKKNSSQSYAVFGTRYGSIDTEFGLEGESLYNVPAGIAHYLEHKLFEGKDGDAFSKYAVTGADANAYTSFDRTCYLFRCSERFYENLEILLSFVSSPYFTKENVEKEQGIINQEIKMYDDVPDWCVLFNLLKIIYHTHPVKIDIAGTVDSIAKITPELLYQCYNTFYNPSNMFLCVSGDVDSNKVIELAEKIIKPGPSKKIIRSEYSEPESVVSDYTEKAMSVTIPIFTIGFKESPKRPLPTVKDILCSKILLEMLVGKTSDLYYELIHDGLINSNFAAEHFYGYGYSCLLFQGESENPRLVKEKIIEQFNNFKSKGVNPDLFMTVKRKIYSSLLREFNVVDDTVGAFIDSVIDNISPFDKLDTISLITPEDILDYICRFSADRSALSVIVPKKTAE